MCVRNRQGFETFFDPFMHVGKPLLQPQDLFADDLKAEVTGLDDSRMHRAHRNLVHAISAYFDERVIFLARFPFG